MMGSKTFDERHNSHISVIQIVNTPYKKGRKKKLEKT